MIYHLKGIWTEQDICDLEDHIDMWRFEIRGNSIRVKEKKHEQARDRLNDESPAQPAAA
jgi:hypothetical protein